MELLAKQPYISHRQIKVGDTYIHVPPNQMPKLVQVTGYSKPNSNPDSLCEWYVREVLPGGVGLSPNTFRTQGFYFKLDIYGMANKVMHPCGTIIRRGVTASVWDNKPLAGLRRRIRRHGRIRLRKSLEFRDAVGGVV